MIGSVVTQVVTSLAKPVTDLLGKRVERKVAKDQLKGKVALAKQSDATQVTLTDAEWETVSASVQEKTWKDEYVTIIVTSPFVAIVGGAIYGAFTGDNRVMDGVVQASQSLAVLGVDLGFLMNAVVLAAIGLKIWRA